MLTVVHTPPQRYFVESGNAFFKFKCKNADGSEFQARRKRQTITLNESDAIVEQQYIQFDITENGFTNTVSFVAVAAPSPLAPTLYTYDPQGFSPFADYEAYYFYIYNKMKIVADFAPYIDVFFAYDANAQLTTLTFEAKKDVDFSIATTFATASIGAVIAPTPDTTPENYVLEYDLKGEAIEGQPTTFYQLFQGSDTPNLLGFVNIAINDILRNFLKSHPPSVPNIFDSNTNFAIKADVKRRYIFTLTEKYGNPLAIQEPQTGYFRAYREAYRGGLAAFSADFTGNYLGIDITNSILTNLGLSQQILASDMPLLSWFNYTEENNLAVKLDIIEYNRIDATPNSYTTNTIITLDDGEVCTVALFDFLQNSIDSIAKIKVRFRTDFGAVSQYATFDIKHIYIEEPTILCFLNNFGVFETVSFTGFASVYSEIQQDKTVVLESEELQEMVKVFNTKYRRSFTLRTGYINKKQAFALEHLLVSEQAYIVKNTGYMPISIIASKQLLIDPLSDIVALELTAEPKLLTDVPTENYFIEW